MSVGLDTSFIVNLLRQGNPHHAATWACYLEHRKAGTRFLLTDHALLEAFSVMSRAPAPTGLRPADARRLLLEHFSNAEIAPVRPGLAWDTIGHTLVRGFWGGRVYDAMIAMATYEAGARLLLTWNLRHFLSVAPPGLEVREPG